MSIDLTAAAAFMATHARLLDRRRFELLRGEGDPATVLATLDAYRNPDGGYGWGLEPDLRSPESQPGAALHAFEVFEDIAPVTARRATALCDWLDSVSVPNGGLPFALPISDLTGCAPWWAGADPTASSLQITAVVATAAHRVATHDPAVAEHPWLARATSYCIGAIRAIDSTPHALELAFAIQLLDAVHGTHPEAAALLDRLGRYIPTSGVLRVEGGTPEEAMRPLDFAPVPGRPARALLAADAVSADVRRLLSQQRDDGGWTVDFASFSPMAALEWRGHMTVRAISVLRRNLVTRPSGQAVVS